MCCSLRPQTLAIAQQSLLTKESYAPITLSVCMQNRIACYLAAAFLFAAPAAFFSAAAIAFLFAAG